MITAARLGQALQNPRFIAGRLLWRSGLCRAFTMTTDLYRLRFFLMPFDGSRGGHQNPIALRPGSNAHHRLASGGSTDSAREEPC